MKILEAKIKIESKVLTRIAVLVDFTPSHVKPHSDIRAIVATNKPHAVYLFLHPGTEVSYNLLEKIAGQGCTIPFTDTNKEFPGWSKRYPYK